ncbi:hypothetical protein ESCO_003432 [Escovopsis weberi]|uniref:Uncharacterized protein n=1 Tax=Escovopsis weberi TaxID=150374 RepID=A0A0M8N032_ESCWE|nr:hypothetical protein ESCO_003432 [Escovopsis weberi]
MAYDPTLEDIIDVRATLLRAGMVADLIDDILDYAEYWHHSTSRADLDVRIRALPASGLSEDYHGNKFLIRSWPVGFTGTYRNDDSGGINVARAFSELKYRETPIKAAPLAKPCGKKYFEGLAPYAMPRLDRPVRKVVFRITSHDQGWTTHSTTGSFHDSCTWFDVGLERFDAEHSCPSCNDADSPGPPLCKLRPIEPPPVEVPVPSPPNSSAGSSPNRNPTLATSPGPSPGWPRGEGRYEYALRERFNEWEIQRNRVAQYQWHDYTVAWARTDNVRPGSVDAQALFLLGENPSARDGKFVGDLRVGDVITVWGRSVQAGWENYVRSVEIDVYWAV